MALLLMIVGNTVVAVIKPWWGDGERPYWWLLSSLFGALMSSCN